MLVLSRKVGEGIRIGNAIEVTVLKINGGKIRLGFTAPRDIPIYRSELLNDQSPQRPGRKHGEQTRVAVPRRKQVR